jgi:hypothetical protein
VERLIAEARRLATEYRRATGKSLGLTGEIARYDAARLLGLDLLPAQEGIGHDAVGRGRWEGQRIQIKGRAIFDEGKPGQRIGQIKAGQDWDVLMLVLMDERFEPYEIHEADREAVLTAVDASRESKRARRGALSVARFKAIGRLVWTRERGPEDDGYWDSGTAAPARPRS